MSKHKRKARLKRKAKNQKRKTDVIIIIKQIITELVVEFIKQLLF